MLCKIIQQKPLDFGKSRVKGIKLENLVSNTLKNRNLLKVKRNEKKRKR